MSNIEKAVAEYKECLGCGHKSCLSLMSGCHKKYNIEHYQMEAYCAIAGSISLDRLREICNAERDGRLVVLRCKDCKQYNTSGCSKGFGWCESMDRGVSDDFYCAYGAKMEDKPCE